MSEKISSHKIAEFRFPLLGTRVEGKWDENLPSSDGLILFGSRELSYRISFSNSSRKDSSVLLHLDKFFGSGSEKNLSDELIHELSRIYKEGHTYALILPEYLSM